MFGYTTLVTALATAVSAGMLHLFPHAWKLLTGLLGSILWDGRFNEMASSSDLNQCKLDSHSTLRNDMKLTSL